MAVYKATYCYPFLNTIDPRVVATAEVNHPAELLKCKVDTSNKPVTGYKIRILDENNNVIFPVTQNEKISPIEELTDFLTDENGLNSGLNGTYLNIAFIQNNYQNEDLTSPVNSMCYKSYNSIYYTVSYKADYYLDEKTFPQLLEYSSENKRFEFKNSDERPQINGEYINKNDIVFVVYPSKSDPNYTDYTGLYQVDCDGNQYILKQYSDCFYNIINKEVLKPQDTQKTRAKILITKGNDANKIFYLDGSDFVGQTESNFSSSPLNIWEDIKGRSINLSSSGRNYKWEITLYQGECEIHPENEEDDDSPRYCDYSNMSHEHYDMVLSRGQILGSTSKRIQLANQPTAELDSSSLLIGEGRTEPIILLNRYAQLLDQNGSAMGDRVVVSNYDSSYGHVYFKDDSLVTADMIEEATQVQFYKYSNVLEDIVAGDLVDVATIGDVKLDGSETTIDGITLSTGMRVLVKDQENAKENGVYLVNELPTQDEEENTKKVAWSRVGGFKDWGDFIGKVLCVKQGQKNARKNFQSQAKAGGTIDESPIYFTDERPILLFPSLLTYKVDFYYDEYGNWNNNTQIDGYTIKDGQTVLYRGRNGVFDMITIVKYYNNSYHQVTIRNASGSENFYFAINLGKKYGDQVIDKNGEVTNILSSAYLLKNTPERTFVKPFIGLQKGQSLCVLNGKKDYPQWIDVKTVNEKFWYVEHNKLELSLNDEILELPFNSETKEDDLNAPYKYDIRSYFKTSDINPFYTYNSPYLKIEIVSEDLVNNNIISKPFLKLQGKYHQLQQASWESYRWTLSDPTGKIIQDTGNKYDKDLVVTFYGLTDKNKYYITLYVEDSLNNSLSSTIEIEAKIQENKLNLPFYANYDCGTHSVVLRYEDLAYVKPSIPSADTVSNLDVVYDKDNTQQIKNLCNNENWDDSIEYDNGQLLITGAKNSESISYGSQFYSFPNSDISNSVKLSNTESHGINYKHYYGSQENVSDKNTKTLQTTETNEIYINTEFSLNDNYCGKFFETTIEDGDNESKSKTLSLFVPDMFVGEDKDLRTIDNLNDQRYRLLMKINEESVGDTSIQFYNEPSKAPYYYLQRKDAKIPENGEFAHYSVIQIPESGETYQLKIFTLSSGDGSVLPYCQFSNNQGNCLILASRKDTIKNYSYWQDGSRLICFDNDEGETIKYPFLDGKTIDSKTVVLCSEEQRNQTWPRVDEEQFYWEEGDEISNLPPDYESLEKSKLECPNWENAGFYQVAPVPRRKGLLSNNDKASYNLKIFISNVDKFLNGTSYSCSPVETDDSQIQKSELMDQNKEKLGYISIEKIEKNNQQGGE